ncbi:MAG: M20/M25/M40 family metallo-hydrolase, partial [Candidatus Krumholzibacteriia bacterium]
MTGNRRQPDPGDLTALRRALHAEPDLSGEEGPTAARLARRLAATQPDAIVAGIGGHGLAVIYGAAGATAAGAASAAAGGPTVVLRAELDALPIQERVPGGRRGTAGAGGRPHASRRPGVGHLCGHDGHMAILAGVGVDLAARRPARGRVVLLFQPAEETGAGGRAVAADPRYRALAPDWVFALHNLPGYPLGQVVIRPGALAAASVGLEIRLEGRTSHAAHPEHGLNPADAVARLVPRLASLGAAPGARPGGGGGGGARPGGGGLSLVTVVHVRVGDRTFGTSPGHGELLATLRADTDAGLLDLRERAVAAAREEAARDGLEIAVGWHDEFPATINHPAAVALARRAATAAGLACAPTLESPFRWSEDL